jgi:hypothetical protein
VTQLLIEPAAARTRAFALPADGQTYHTKSSVAELSAGQIADMPHDELVDAIRVVLVPSVDEDRLQFQERSTLLRLVYLARRCCRNQGY